MAAGLFEEYLAGRIIPETFRLVLEHRCIGSYKLRTATRGGGPAASASRDNFRDCFSVGRGERTSSSLECLLRTELLLLRLFLGWLFSFLSFSLSSSACRGPREDERLFFLLDEEMGLYNSGFFSGSSEVDSTSVGRLLSSSDDSSDGSSSFSSTVTGGAIIETDFFLFSTSRNVSQFRPSQTWDKSAVASL